MPSKPSGLFGVLSSFFGIDFTLLGLLTITSFRILCLLGTLFKLSYLGISFLRILLPTPTSLGIEILTGLGLRKLTSLGFVTLGSGLPELLGTLI